MSVTVTASLVDTGSPAPAVELVVDGIPSGAAYAIEGAVSGRSWPVPGGVGVGTGSSLVLLDNRAALNMPVQYRVLSGGAVYESGSVLVPMAADVLVQSLDGSVVAVPVVLTYPTTLPEEPAPQFSVFQVPGRARPPVHHAPGGEGGSAIEVVTATAGSVALRSLMRAGAPVVIRFGAQVWDAAPVQIAVLTAAPSAAVGFEDWRRWSLSYLLVDDPQPSAVLSAWTWDDFDEAMTSRTWGEFDALFAGSTWDDLDTYPWGQL